MKFLLRPLLFYFILLSCQEQEKPFTKTSDTLFIPVKDSGVDFNNSITESSSFNYFFYESLYNGAGVGVADFDGDGLEDVFFCGNQVADRLYRNLGGLHFEDVSSAAGILDDGGWSSGVAIADINADGLPDIYVCRFMLEDSTKRKNLLYINQGEMSFKESAAEYGLADEGYSSQASFLDYDKDGLLDLYIVNQPPNNSAARQALSKDSLYRFSDRLYHNEGSLFREVTEEAGLIDRAYSHMALCSDINGDGWTDIYITNDFDEPDFLYINQTDGTFKNEALSQLQHMSNFTMGTDIGDIDNDGLQDIFTADMVAEDNKRLKTNMSGMNPKKFNALVEQGYHHQYMFNTLQVNRGHGHFSEIAQLAEVQATDWSWSALIVDLDMDGLKDLFVTNGLKRDVRDNDFNIARRKRVQELKEEAEREGRTGIDVNLLELLSLSPSTPISNYAFQNMGDYRFQKAMDSWGLTQKGMSHGAAYADLDNDGDLDLILNNMDEPASILENKREAYVDHHWFQVELKGSMPFGTKVELRQGEKLQMMEYQTVRGYMSSQTGILSFGLGKDSQALQVTVHWPDGKKQQVDNLQVDQRIILDHTQATESTKISEDELPYFLEASLLDYRHKENDFDDFKTEILLPHRMSTIGPAAVTADVNGDGREDIFIGAAKGMTGKLFLQNDEGFVEGPALPASNRYEDTGACFLDADGDGDMDLYVVSGGNEQRVDLYDYQDRLYLNDGKGNFKDATTKLPNITSSGGCARPYDVDGDGDMDLLVAGRQVPGRYPYPAKSYLLINEGGRFSDGSAKLPAELREGGMITDALWSDLNGDSLKELCVVGEWMPISFYGWRDGALQKTNEVAHSTGWWNVLSAMDMDGDGDMDLAVGNLGLNIKYKASPEAPFEIFSKDFDGNGSNDIYMAYYQDGNCFPVRGRECSSQQLPFVKEKFPSYDAFSQASVYEVLGEDTAGALHYSAEQFASIFLINEGQGNWTMKEMPVQAQFSVVNSIIQMDVDKDGNEDLLLFGNQHDREVETTRSDASYGLLMLSDGKGQWKVEPQWRFGIYEGGNVRQALAMDWNNKGLIITVNNDDQTRCFVENQINE